jgi:membrane fusion protein, copper/silver efflux system
MIARIAAASVANVPGAAARRWSARWMRRALSAACGAALIMFAGCGRGREPLPPGTALQRAGAWQVGVANAPDPPRVGDNTFTVVARDSAGRPMPGTIDLVISMPAMGAMPYMESRGRVTAAGAGVFRARYGLPMQGEWDAVVTLHPRAGPPAEAQYRISTSVRGVALAGGTPAPGGTPPGAEAATASESPAGTVVLDAARRQALGIRVAAVGMRSLVSTVRAPGRVAVDEAHQADVSLRFGGWVRTLPAAVTGRPVRQGQVLLTVYSPELLSAEHEYLEALRAAWEDRGKEVLAGSSEELASAARERLALWDVAPQDLDALAQRGRVDAAVPVRAPVSGVIVEKNVVLGSAFTTGQVLFRIARLDPVWVIASVPQSDLPLVRPGMAAAIRDPYADRAPWRGRVQFVYPALDSMTRTGEVRIAVANPSGVLIPGTFVDVMLEAAPLPRLAVPEEAVLPTGDRHVVFVDLGEGRLAPREVRLGRLSQGWYEVLGGLTAGERVVTSGNFLVAAESRLRSAAQNW